MTWWHVLMDTPCDRKKLGALTTASTTTTTTTTTTKGWGLLAAASAVCTIHHHHRHHHQDSAVTQQSRCDCLQQQAYATQNTHTFCQAVGLAEGQDPDKQPAMQGSPHPLAKSCSFTAIDGKRRWAATPAAACCCRGLLGSSNSNNNPYSTQQLQV
jgi:hypothetical protein